jgi:hypothetical protein
MEGKLAAPRRAHQDGKDEECQVEDEPRGKWEEGVRWKRKEAGGGG